MCSEFTPDIWFDNSIINFTGNLYCPNTMSSSILGCVHQKIFQCFERRDYQCLQCSSKSQVRNKSFEEQTKSFPLKFGQGIYVFEETKISIQDVTGEEFCPGRYCSRQNCVVVQTWNQKDENCYEFLQHKACCTF